MTILFKAKTNDGFCLKVLTELLQNNLQSICFIVDSKGLKARTMDHNKTILIDLKLDSNAFSVYKYKGSSPLYLGINLLHFHKMLKNIKKKDSVELFITEENSDDLGIKILPEKSGRVTTSFIKIQELQTIDIDLPDGYERPVLIPSGEFQKMCKDLAHISKITHISSSKSIIKFSTDAGDIMKRVTEFGEMDGDEEDENASEEEEDEDEERKEEVRYNDEFETEQLSKISKLAGLNPTMQVYPKKDSYLLFRSQVGSLGKISIYLKSKKLQEIEATTVTEE